MPNKIDDVIERLSPLEVKVIPFLDLKLDEIAQKTGLDMTSLLRALSFLENKGVLKINKETQKIIELGINGIYYKKTSLPERKLLTFLEKNKNITLNDAKKLSKLSDNEFNAALGLLKGMIFIEIKNNRIQLIASKENIAKKTPEEHFLGILPIEEKGLDSEMRNVFSRLLKRKDIIILKEKNVIDFELSDLGKQLLRKEIKSDLIEEVTPDIIKTWGKNRKFRAYEIKSNVPVLHGGKRHFVNQSIEYARRIWLDLGFKEMTGTILQTTFWNFDSLFTPQSHPAREMQDTFFLKDIEGKLPNKEIVSRVKQAHESGVDGSKG